MINITIFYIMSAGFWVFFSVLNIFVTVYLVKNFILNKNIND